MVGLTNNWIATCFSTLSVGWVSQTSKAFLSARKKLPTVALIWLLFK